MQQLAWLSKQPLTQNLSYSFLLSQTPQRLFLLHFPECTEAQHLRGLAMILCSLTCQAPAWKLEVLKYHGGLCKRNSYYYRNFKIKEWLHRYTKRLVGRYLISPSHAISSFPSLAAPKASSFCPLLLPTNLTVCLYLSCWSSAFPHLPLTARKTLVELHGAWHQALIQLCCRITARASERLHLPLPSLYKDLSSLFMATVYKYGYRWDHVEN